MGGGQRPRGGEGWVGRGGGRKLGAKGEGPGPRYCALSAPTHPLPTTRASALHLSLPLSCPEARGPGLSRTRGSEWQVGREASLVQRQRRGALSIAGPTAACRFPSSDDCSSPPGRAAAHCAAGDGRAATAAAPAQGAATQPTVRAWPAAGELPTSGQRGRLAGPGMEQQRAGDEELRSRAEGEEEGGWGGSQLGRGSG